MDGLLWRICRLTFLCFLIYNSSSYSHLFPGYCLTRTNQHDLLFCCRTQPVTKQVWKKLRKKLACFAYPRKMTLVKPSTRRVNETKPLTQRLVCNLSCIKCLPLVLIGTNSIVPDSALTRLVVCECEHMVIMCGPNSV